MSVKGRWFFKVKKYVSTTKETRTVESALLLGVGIFTGVEKKEEMANMTVGVRQDMTQMRGSR